MTIIYFIIALGILIFIHELGHFIMAKRAGICVEAFSLGFGPRLIGFKWGDTDYRISALPLGGYVKMLGEDPDDEDAADDPRSYASKSVWARLSVVAAGPLMNIILCLFLMPIVFMIGREQPIYLSESPVLVGVRSESPAASIDLKKGDLIVAVDGIPVEKWEGVLNKILLAPGGELNIEVERGGNRIEKVVKLGELPGIKGGYLGIEPRLILGNEAVVEGVSEDGPGARAGIREGDLITSFAGKPVGDWIDLTTMIEENEGKPARISVKRAGGIKRFTITPEFNEEYERWIVGISRSALGDTPMHMRKYGFFDAIAEGMKENVKLAGLTFTILKKLLTFQLSYKVLGGPIVIAKVSAAAAASGLSAFLYFLAFLSMQLAILNFMPIPVLDGGHIVFLTIEAIMRKPLNIRVRNIAMQVGFIILISFMLLVTVNDIERTWGVSTWVKSLF